MTGVQTCALPISTARQDYLEFIGQGILRPADTWFTPEHPFHNPDVVQEADTPDLATPLVADYCTDNPDNCTDGKINMEFQRSEEHTSELQSRTNLVCRLLLEKKKKNTTLKSHNITSKTL